MKSYAGIGSRKTPKEVQQKMTEIAIVLSRSGYCLYSGGADGADTAFEIGANQKQIFLPWDGFNGKQTRRREGVVPPFSIDLVNQYHPAPTKLSKQAQKLMSRNSYQVLGPDLYLPVEFVLCWTEDGKASGEPVKHCV